MTRSRSPLLTVAALAAIALCLQAFRRAATRRRIERARLPDKSVNEQPEVHNEQLDTYQDLLDESLHLTFPASDPISAHAATRCGDDVSTSANASDWRLHPGSAAEPTARERSTQ
jgi:hypothetical protein